jgi:enamine deaminase RidA (YjgF/YER057c/UK114 family)
MKKVIDVHDEVMPKMGEMSNLIKELESKIDTTVQGKSYAKAQQDVKDAYDFMMTWMSDFSDKFPHEEEGGKADSEKISSQMKLLREEEIKVHSLKDQINSSITNAKQLLEKS